MKGLLQKEIIYSLGNKFFLSGEDTFSKEAWYAEVQAASH